MIRVNHRLMRRRRLECGWTPEKLAEESGLDARTVRRLERGRSRTRLQSAVAVAQALELDLSVLVLGERTAASGSNGAGDALSAVFEAVNDIMQRDLMSDRETVPKEPLCVLSMLLTRNLVPDRRAAGDQETGDTDRVVAAFKAADSAIQATLSCGGEWGAEEAACVLSLLLARYGTAFGRRSDDAVEEGLGFVQVACDRARQALPNYMESE